MELLCWTSLIFSREGFPRDEEGKPFLPSNTIKEAITSAIIFYYIKKDKEIENKVRKYLNREILNIKEVVKDIKEIVLEKYNILEDLKIPEKIYLPQENIEEKYVEVFDLKDWVSVDSFKTEVFKGIVNLDISSPNIEKIKAAAHSFAEALAKMEHSMLKEHPLAKNFYESLIPEIKQWEIPLRIGMWTEHRFKGNLLFFWKIKEIREKLIKTLKIDIKPRYVIYIPRENATTGWSELKTKN